MNFNRMKKRRRSLSLLMAVIMLLTTLPLGAIPSFAADPPVVTTVRFVREHDGFEVSGAYLEIIGENLVDVELLVDMLDGGTDYVGDRLINTANFQKFTFTAEEALNLTGRMFIGTQSVDLALTSFPNLSSAESIKVNIDKSDDLILNGTNLNEIKLNAGDTDKVTAEYGKTQKKEFFYNASGTDASNRMTLVDPQPFGELGRQDILFTKETPAAGSDPEMRVEYRYMNSFRFIENLGVTDPEMFPNTGAKGDYVYITAEDFNPSKKYTAYFLKALDGTDDFSELNRAEFVALAIDIDGTNRDKLTVKVPDGEDFELMNYYVVLTSELNNEVIAEQVIMEPGTSKYAQFTVIGSGYKPTIENIYPDRGPDTGLEVQLSGRNLLTLSIPDLDTNSNFDGPPTSSDGNYTLDIQYENGIYKGAEVEIVRNITVQIGKKAKFYKDGGDFVVRPGIPDDIMVSTDSIDDASIDPFKDVVIELTTTLTDVGDPTKVYVFKQIVTRENGFEFIPSTLTPEIDDIVPRLVHVEDIGAEYQFAEETLFTIKGDQFLVDRQVVEGAEIVRYPTILIKKDGSNALVDSYQIGFFPNETVDGVTGVIRYKASESGPSQVLRDGNGVPYKLEMLVVDDKNNVVNGTLGNDVGTKILITIPNETVIADIGFKHVQVFNPRRGNDAYGDFTIKKDYVEFIETGNVPIIEEVDPNIVTVDGGVDVVITGSNFHEGVVIYLDGEEITSFDREIDPSGNKLTLTFKAPPGREGTTQLQVMNPNGGLAVADFTYVKAFNKDPKITNFEPTKGIAETLVLINGDNFLRPDPTVATTEGLDGYRLLGSRVYLDGQDVNDYNVDGLKNITFLPYETPNNEIFIKIEADRARYSNFVENTVITKRTGGAPLDDDPVFFPSFDNDGSPLLTDYAGEEYRIKLDKADGKLKSYGPNGQIYGEITQHYDSSDGSTVLTLPTASGGGSPVTFDIFMDNRLLSIKTDVDAVKYVDLADYGESIILKSNTGEIFTVYSDYAGEIKFTNGQDKLYTFGLKEVGSDYRIIAEREGTTSLDVTVNKDSITIGGTTYTYETPYRFNPTTKEIYGDRTKVVSKEQIMFTVPFLTTGTGYKDLAVVNPDTKRDEKLGTQGFYFIKQSSSNPIITKVVPDQGSIAGGYTITIHGNDFEDDSKVYIDSVLVPEEDTKVNLDGTEIVVVVPECTKDLIGDYGVDRLAVPVVVLNQDGGSAYDRDGFTYMIPTSEPTIEELIPVEGTSNGGEIVEIIGYEFRFFEPYISATGEPNYNEGDKFTDLFKNKKWDDLLSPTVDPDALRKIPDDINPYYDYHYESEILPTVYFGSEKAKIVEFSKGYIKVITPPHQEGKVDVYVVNNDQGISNKVPYTFQASSPDIDRINPSTGRRTGQEKKDIYGESFFPGNINGYYENDHESIVHIPDVEAVVRFADIDNKDLPRTDPNFGQINSNRASVELEGGLRVSFNGEDNTLTMSINENNKVYKRTFENYDNTEVYLPAEMLIHTENNLDRYYVPYGYKGLDGASYENMVFEYVKVYIEDRRLIVERGYAPKVEFDNSTHLIATTPSYYTIDTVDVTVMNNDGGRAKIKFRYTNPDSAPLIKSVRPETLSIDSKYWQIEGSIQGGIEIEIIGTDLREGAKVYIGNKQAQVVEHTTTTIDDTVYDVIIAKVPVGTNDDIDKRYPVIVENPDFGLANSTVIENLIGPNHGSETLPYFFIYKKPLSGPRIDRVEPEKTSAHGGNELVIYGSDFREGALVIIGSRGGVPVYNGVVEEKGTVLRITTPENMTVGPKSIQVINKDYGTGSKENALTVISYPVVTQAEGLEGASTGSISVEGGQKVKLTGTGFDKGAKVILGGDRTVKDEETTVTGLEGHYKDDSTIIVSDGIEVQKVEYIDENTLIITTPAINEETNFSITVLNGDTGISSGDISITYTEPKPTRPLGLKARVVDGRYISLYDYYSDNQIYYEIYYYMGNKKAGSLNKNRDFSYLGTTEVEPYKVTKLPGIENLGPGDRVWFMLKAVNEFGASSFSPMVYVRYEDIEHIDDFGPEDIDGDLGVPDGSDYMHETRNDQSVLTLSEDIGTSLSVLLKGQEYSGLDTRIITLPGELVKKSYSLVNVNYGDSVLQFMPINLNSHEFNRLGLSENTYGQILLDLKADEFISLIKRQIPRGKGQVSKILELGLYAVNNQEVEEIGAMNGTMDLQIQYDDTYLSPAQVESLAIYSYNKRLNQWVAMPSTIDRERKLVTARILEPGFYVVLTNL